MLSQLIIATTLIIFATGQESNRQQNDEAKQNQDARPPVLYLGTPNPEFPQQNDIQPPGDLKQFYDGQYSSELYRLPYLEPQYQNQGAYPRFQPQIVYYGPGGQGQPILINPGNPPGNFLIPQGPGPNVIVRNNPQNPQGTLFPVAGYPKPAHIPPIEKDAEEIPTNPANVPPLSSEVRPVTKPRTKPEKIETFNEPTQPDQNVDDKRGGVPQIGPETVSLRPGQRFFVLNGDQLFSYPYEPQPQIQNDLPVFRYTNAQLFPQNPPKFLQTFGHQEPSQVLQGSQETAGLVPVSNLIPPNSFITPQIESKPQQSASQAQQTETQSSQPNQPQPERQYYQAAASPVNLPEFYLTPQAYPVTQRAGPLIQNIQDIQGAQGITSKEEIVQPQAVGQFRFTPSGVPGHFAFKDDYENDAIVVDASYDPPSSFDGRRGSSQAEEINSTTPKPQQPAEKEPEPSMAQAGPQGTAIAGPGGVAGSAPRGTAIVGKGGLAVSSPQATAVAGTKDEEKKKRPVKKNA